VDGVTIMHVAQPTKEIRLPAVDTKIHRCLVACASCWPTTILTQQIATHASLNGKETSALMAVLAARGLVERLEERRGLIGGSIWRLTKLAAQLLRLKGVSDGTGFGS